jgi:hypothetical protein
MVYFAGLFFVQTPTADYAGFSGTLWVEKWRIVHDAAGWFGSLRGFSSLPMSPILWKLSWSVDGWIVRRFPTWLLKSGREMEWKLEIIDFVTNLSPSSFILIRVTV